MIFSKLVRLIRLNKQYGAGFSGLGIFLWKVFAIHFIYKERIIFWNSNLKWIVHRDFQSSKNPWYYHISEKTEFALLSKELKAGDIFYDVGANAGLYSFWIAAHHPVQCYLFEPNPRHQNFIRRMIQLNQLEQKCILQPFALGEENGMKFLTLDKDVNNKISDQPTNLVIEMRRMDDLIELPRPSILKLDTEGYERMILQGGLQVLANEILRIIIIESVDIHFEKCHELLRSFGFERMMIRENRPGSKDAFYTTPSGNTIYLRNEKAILSDQQTR
ncbi:MAG: FkbM family methyltransferase [Saprospiraceae bacterium]|nr:FkbM family methyltransferase [Saprospiraceae bacterium]